MVTEKLVKSKTGDLSKTYTLNVDLNDVEVLFNLVEKSTGRNLNLSQLCSTGKNKIKIYIPNQIKFPSNNFRYTLTLKSQRGKLTQIATGDFIIAS